MLAKLPRLASLTLNENDALGAGGAALEPLATLTQLQVGHALLWPCCFAAGCWHQAMAATRAAGGIWPAGSSWCRQERPDVRAADGWEGPACAGDAPAALRPPLLRATGARGCRPPTCPAQVLEMRECGLRSVPSSLSQLTNLRSLLLGYNSMTQVWGCTRTAKLAAQA